MKTNLFVFDFDGTLFRSPYPPKEWKGDPDDWWRMPGSLGPPCVPEKPSSEWWNSEVVAAAKKAYSDRESNVVVLITGRRATRFDKRISDLLSQKGIQFDYVLMKDDVGTLVYKVTQVRKLVKQYKVKKLEVWDDRKTHLKKLGDLGRSLGLEVVEHPVMDRPRPIACSFDQIAKEEEFKRTGDKFRRRLYDTE